MMGRAFKDRMIEFQFLVFQFHHFFFNRMAHEQPHNGHFLLLADPMRTIGCLIFHRRIPPGIQVKDVRGFGEIEPLAAGFETQQKNRRCAAFLEFMNQFFPGRSRRGAIQPDIRNLSARGIPVPLNPKMT